MTEKADEIIEQIQRLRIGNQATDHGHDQQASNTSNSTYTFTPTNQQMNPEFIKEVAQLVLNQLTRPNIPDDRDQEIALNANNVSQLDKIPDMVKCLREFSGRPGEFNSWRKTVDRIFKAYESLKDTPKYFAILHTVRHKIVGDADTALESYRTPLDWGKIRKCLMMHYSDKRDIGTLEYQMTTLAQRHDSIPIFYQKVYQHLSLILDKIACQDTSEETIYAMTSSYREKALDTFIRGLNGDLPRLLSIREPTTLPQALHLCQKLDNMTFRMNYAQGKQNTAPPRPPRQNEFFQSNVKNKFYPELAYVPSQPRNNHPFKPRPFVHKNFPNYSNQPRSNNYQFPNYNTTPHRPNNYQFRTQPPNFFQGNSFNNRPNFPPKPPVPMDIDQSIQTRQVNYQNRPNYQQNHFPQKRTMTQQTQPPNKVQRTYYTDTDITYEDRDKEATEEFDVDPNQLFTNDDSEDSYEQKLCEVQGNTDDGYTTDNVYFLD